MIKDIEASAAALYDGGWRFGDWDALRAEYNLTREETYDLCEALKKLDTGETEYKKYREWVEKGRTGEWPLEDRETLLAWDYAAGLGDQECKEFRDDAGIYCGL